MAPTRRASRLPDGRSSIVGWWYCMPIVLALKSTPSELAIMAYGLWACDGVAASVCPHPRVAGGPDHVRGSRHREPFGARGSLRAAGSSLLLLIAFEHWHRRTAGRPRWSWTSGLALVVAQFMTVVYVTATIARARRILETRRCDAGRGDGAALTRGILFRARAYFRRMCSSACCEA